MKYGIIVYGNATNIGDDIQSYAASRLLPRVDYYIEREQIDTFRPEEDEPVIAIVNGWFSHNKLAWPPSPCIHPLFISMHFQISDPLFIGERFLEGIGGDSLREFSPVGCRDTETLQLLERYGIGAYFSACATLTLEPVFPKSDGDPYVLLIDVSSAAEEYARRTWPHLRFVSITQNGTDVVDRTASWQERMRRVEERLTLFQNASAVVTTRIHAALPSLALKTPVLFLSDSNYDVGRLSGITDLFRHTNTDIWIRGNYDYDLNSPPENPGAYLEKAQAIRERVRAFLNESQTCTPRMHERFAAFDGEWLSRAVWKNEMLFSAARSDSAREPQKVQKHVKMLEKKLSQQQKRIHQLQAQCSADSGQHSAGIGARIRRLIGRLRKKR